jgi:murein peptide amidase A
LKEQYMPQAGLGKQKFFSWANVIAGATCLVHAAAFANPPTATSNTTATAMASANSPSAAASLSQDELQKWCDPVTRVLPKIKLKPCMKAGLASSGAKSVRGLPILSREIPARVTGTGTAPIRVMVIGGIHGDELTSSAIVFRWLELVEQPEAREYRWQIVPLLNPDGALAKPAKRVNANGVDLNRNFPTPNWEKEARHYWVVKTASDPRRFPGKAPISEPESRWLHNEIVRFKPDVIVSIHAPFGILDFDGPIDPPYKLGALTLMPVGIYPGSLGNYGGVHKGVPVVTIELPHALDLPSEAEIKNIWRDMLAWIDSNIGKGKTEVAQRAVKGLR